MKKWYKHYLYCGVGMHYNNTYSTVSLTALILNYLSDYY